MPIRRHHVYELQTGIDHGSGLPGNEREREKGKQFWGHDKIDAGSKHRPDPTIHSTVTGHHGFAMAEGPRGDRLPAITTATGIAVATAAATGLVSTAVTSSTTPTTTTISSTTAATTETAAATSATVSALAGAVDLDITTVQLLAVHLTDGPFRFVVIAEGDETKTAAATSLAIFDNHGILNLAESLETTTKRVGVCAPGEGADKEFDGH